TRVELRISGFRRLAAELDNSSRSRPALPVPVGASAEGIVYIDLAAVGSAIVAAAGERERARMIQAWLKTIASTHSPGEVTIRLDTAGAPLLGEIAELQQFAGNGELVSELDELVLARESGEGSHHPVIAVVSGDSGSELMERTLRHGPVHGIYTIVSQA